MRAHVSHADGLEPDASQDRGLTLIELIVYMLLATIVIGIVATIMINSFRVDTQVRETAAATSDAQLLAESLGRGIRNAGYIEATAPAVGQVYVRTQSRDSGTAGDWVCSAWFFDGDTISWTTSPTALPATPVPGSMLVLLDEIEAVGSDPVLAAGADGRSLSVSLSAAEGAGAPVLLDTTIVSRQPRILTVEERAQCFVP